MFTQCPTCRKHFTLTKEQLLENEVVYCDACAKDFNAFDLLSEQAQTPGNSPKKGAGRKQDKNRKHNKKKKSSSLVAKPVEPEIIEDIRVPIPAIEPLPVSTSMQQVKNRLPWEKETKTVNINWLAGTLVALGVLAFQLIYFEFDNLCQNPSFRPKLEKIAAFVDFQLPEYRNLSDMEVLQSSMTSIIGGYTFKAVIINQGQFFQKMPKIQLTLLDFNETPFAQRIFQSQEFIPKALGLKTGLDPDETIEASLTIAAPTKSVGGYRFDLID